MSDIKKKFIGTNQVGASQIRLENNSALKARNSSDTADVEIVKLNAADAVEMLANPLLPSDPTAALQAATKQYADTKIAATEKGAALGVATLDGGGKIPASQLPNSVMEYLGQWAASTNTPTLANGVGNTGDVYQASDAGTVNFGAGNITFAAGDWVIYNGTIWEKSINSNAVASVNGLTGIVVVNAINELTGDITAGPASGSQSQVATIANGAVTNAKIANGAVDNVKIAAGVDAAKIGVGNVDNTEFGYLDGVTSGIQGQIDGKANTALSNLASTALNADIVPAANNARDLGSAALQFNQVRSGNYRSYDYASAFSTGDITSGSNVITNVADTSAFQVDMVLVGPGIPTRTFITAVGANSITLEQNATVTNVGATIAAQFETNFISAPQTVNSVSSGIQIRTGNTQNVRSGHTIIRTGNSSANDSGDILLNTGSATGTRGRVRFNGSEVSVEAPLNMNGQLATNGQDPVNPQDLATKNYVDNAISSSTQFGKETFTLSVGDITNKYVDLAHEAIPQSVLVMVKGAGVSFEGDDWTQSVVGLVTRISWNGTELDGVLAVGDKLQIQYGY